MVPPLQIAAFRTGFESIFPLSTLALFYEDELEAMLCGEQSLCARLCCKGDRESERAKHAWGMTPNAFPAIPPLPS